MPCPFCQASNARGARACHFCGGPLRGVERPASPPLRPREVKLKGAVPLVSSRPVSIPALDPIPNAPPAKPVIVARHARATGTPRIVAVLFCGEENGSHPLLVLENGELQLWDVQRDEWHLFPARKAFRKPGLTMCAAFSLECGAVATGYESGQVRLQRLEPRGESGGWKCHALHVIEAHRGPVLSLAIAKTRFYSAGSDGAIVLLNLPGAPNTATPNTAMVNTKSEVVLDGLSSLSCLAVSPGGHHLALGADDGQVQMWHLSEDGTQARLDWTSGKDLSMPRSRVKSLGFAPNGHMLLSCNAQGEGCLWAARTGHRLPFLSQPNGLILPVFACDSRLLCHAGTSKGTPEVTPGGIALFDAWTGALRHRLPPVEGEVQAVAFSPAAGNEARETLLIVAGSQQIVAWKVEF